MPAELFNFISRHMRICDGIDEKRDAGKRVSKAHKKQNEDSLAWLQAFVKKVPGGFTVLDLLTWYSRVQERQEQQELAASSADT